MQFLEQFAFAGLLPTWQHIKLVFLFEQLFVSNEYKTLLIFYDNSTVYLAELLLHRFAIANQPMVRHDLVIFNIDRYRPDPPPFIGFGGFHNHDKQPLVPKSLGSCFARSVTVELFANHNSLDVSMFRWDVYFLQPETKWIRIYLQEAVYFLNYYRYMALIELLDGDELRLSTFNYMHQQPLQLFADSELSMYQQLFFDQRIDMLGTRLYMYGDMDVPNLYRATAFDKQGRAVVGVAGFYAAICSMIEDYFNCSISFSTNSRPVWRNMLVPSEFEKMGETYVEYELLKQRVFRTIHIMPGVQETRERCSLFDEYSAEGQALYPHRQENYVVLVPNERQLSPELWMLLAASPLTTVWLSAIINYSLVRYSIIYAERRRVLRFGGRICDAPPWDVDRVLLETCGLAFGMSIAVRPSGRADRLLLLSISIFAIVSGVFCSGLLIRQFAFGELRPKIDSIADLVYLPNMTVMMPNGLVVNETTWNANHTLMHMSLQVIYGEILRKNTKCTYVLPESVADVLLSEPHMSEEDGKFPVFHKLRDRVVSKHMSMYTSEEILRLPLNTLMQRMRYMGLICYYEHTQRMTLKVRDARATQSALGGTSMQAFGAPTSSTSITLLELAFILWLLCAGQFCSVAIFCIELLVARMQGSRQKNRRG